jgi:hypothetical protein
MNILRQDQQPEPRESLISKDWRAWAKSEGYIQDRTIPVSQGPVTINLEVWVNPFIPKDPFLLYHPPIPHTEGTEALYILDDKDGLDGMLEVTTQMAAMVIALAQGRVAFPSTASPEQEDQAQPPRDQIILEATYYAARGLYYDTSEQAQLDDWLKITMMDMALVEPLPPGVTHRFYVLIGEDGYGQYGVAAYVNRTSEGYVVEADATRDARLKQELDIRESVLDVALEHFLGHTPYPGDDLTQKPILIERLLLGTQAEVKHPVVREMAPESERALRQWLVQVGDHVVNVGMFLVKHTEDEVRFQVLD